MTGGDLESVLDGFYKEIKSYVRNEHGNIKVDWHGIQNLLVKSREGSYDEGLHRCLIMHLTGLGILSFDGYNNYEVYSKSLNLNPWLGPELLYFRRLEDAEAYKNAKYSKAIYPVNIRKNIVKG